MSEMINYGVLPDSRVILIKDHGRGLPNGVGTLNNNNLVEQDFATIDFNYASTIPAPHPYEQYPLTKYYSLLFTGGL